MCSRGFLEGSQGKESERQVLNKRWLVVPPTTTTTNPLSGPCVSAALGKPRHREA